ncbi:MAG: binary toxin-like calcium binding domain-containing protein [Candidatus Helarchaeota archaeon]
MFLLLLSLNFLTNNNLNKLYNGSNLDDSWSSNPDNPETLTNGGMLHQWYSSVDATYYYNTYQMDYTNYHLIILWTNSGTDYADLYLYSDVDYTNLVDSSTSGPNIYWLVYKPTSSSFMYPKTWAQGVTLEHSIVAYSGYRMYVGSSYTWDFTSYLCGGLSTVELTNDTSYTVDVEVPSNMDLELHVFRVPAGTCTKQDYHYSDGGGNGYDERVTFTPQYNGDYAILITRKSSSSFPGNTGFVKVWVRKYLNDDESYHFSPYYSSIYFATYYWEADRYNLLWVKPDDINADYDLYLYTDSTYSDPVCVDSATSRGNIEWLAYRVAAYHRMYPKVYRYSGSGSAYIECEAAYNLTVNQNFTRYLNDSDIGAIAQAYLSTSKTYYAFLDVPSGCDFDLYTFLRLSGSNITYDLYYSNSSTLGQDEQVSFKPAYFNAYYAFVIIRKSGSGNATLIIKPDSDNDGLIDDDEINIYGTNPNNNDTDSDQLIDGDEINTYGTNPLNNDTDTDGISDGDEVNTYSTDPKDNDTDNDGMPDGWEVNNGLNPLGDDSGTDSDSDGLTNFQEYQYGTDPKDSDTDNDGMPDGWEVNNGLNPLSDDSANDPDSDSLNNLQEYQNNCNPQDNDIENDGMPDGWEVNNGLNPLSDDSANDPDSDGLSNLQEYQNNCNPQDNDTDNDGVNDGDELNTYNTDPTDSDTDNDGMPDGWEINNGLNPLSDDSANDPDSDGLNNLQEYQNNCNPQDNDTDNDLINDGDELNTYNTDPTDSDTDNDGMPDGWEVNNGLNPLINDAGSDSDSDGLTNLQKYQNNCDPNDSDTDNDDLSDYLEINTYQTNPTIQDTDGDSLLDGAEVNLYGTDPNKSDSDNDGLTDEKEIFVGGLLINELFTGSADWIEIINLGDVQDMTGWKLYIWDENGQQIYNFPTGFIIGKNAIVQIHEYGEIWDNNGTDLYIGNNIYWVSSTKGAVSLVNDTDGVVDHVQFNGWTGTPLPGTDWTGVFYSGSDSDIYRITLEDTDTASDWYSSDSATPKSLNPSQYITDPMNPDTDRDDLTDGAEVNQYGTNPAKSDTDGDGLKDGEEINTYNTNPKDEDTDNDGYNDGYEVSHGTDPNDPASYPASISEIPGFNMIFAIITLVFLLGIIVRTKIMQKIKVKVI